MRNLAWRGIAALAVVSVAGVLSVQAAQPPGVDRDEPGPQEVAIPSDASQRALADAVDESVIGEKGQQAASAARSRLRKILTSKVAAIDRVCGLSDVQKEKLNLAGRLDIKQLDERLDGLREKFVKGPRGAGFDDFRRLASPDFGELRKAYRFGPFGEESLFEKTRRRILLAEQAQKFERRRESAAHSTKKINADNARDLEHAGRLTRDVHDLIWNRNDGSLALMTYDQPVEICSGLDLKPARTVGVGRKIVAFDFSPQRNVVAIAENSTRAFVLNVATGQEMALETGNPQPWVTFSPDGKFLATGGYGTRSVLWSADSGKRIREFDAGPTTGALRPVFSPDGTILAVGNRNSSTHLFDVATGRLLHVLPQAMTQELKFDPSGKRLALAYVNGSLGVWNVASGELIKNVSARAEELYSVDWSPDGKIIASSGLNAAVSLWNAANLALLHEIEAPEWVIFVRFNPEGTRLIFAGGASAPGGERNMEVCGVPE